MPRAVVIVFALSLLAAPFDAGAQPAKPMPRVGVLRNLPSTHAFHQAFHRGLQELGYTEGKVIE
jgi:hypothetical protein